MLSGDPAKNVAMGHDNDILLRAATKVLSNPLSALVERNVVGSIEALLASPVRRERRKVKALQFGIALEDLLCGPSVARESIAFLKLRQQDDLAQAAKPLNGGSVSDLGALQRALERRRKYDLRTRLQVRGKRWQTRRLLFTERRQRRICDRIVIGDILRTARKGGGIAKSVSSS